MAIRTVPYEIVESFSGTTTQTYTTEFDALKYLAVVNRGTGNLVFSVKDIGVNKDVEITVTPSDRTFEAYFPDFTQVEITTANGEYEFALGV